MNCNELLKVLKKEASISLEIFCVEYFLALEEMRMHKHESSSWAMDKSHAYLFAFKIKHTKTYIQSSLMLFTRRQDMTLKRDF